MKARLPLVVMLAGSLTFLASLYLTWISMTPAAAALSSRSALGLPNLFGLSTGFSSDGWGSPFGQVAAITAVALCLGAVVALRRPELDGLLPFDGCAIALAVLALVNAAALRTQMIFRGADGGLSVHLGVGLYVGGAAAVAAVLGAAWVRRDELGHLGNATVAAATLLTVGIVAAYVLPTLNAKAPHVLTAASAFQFVGGVGNYGMAVMVLIASYGLTFWFGNGPPLRRLAAAAVVLVLAVGGFSVLGTHAHWPYEAWLAIGCAVGLLALAAATNRQRPIAALGRADVIALDGATLVFASLFFNWEQSCSPEGSCFVSNGWGGGIIGGLAAVLVVLHLGFRRLSPELAVAVAIYVIGTALAITARHSLGYGAFLGFAGTALLLFAVGLEREMPALPRFRVVPIAAAVAFLAIPALALTRRIEELSFWSHWQQSLLQTAAIVVTLRLLGRWLTGPAADAELLLLPLALIVLTGLDIGELPHLIFWDGWLSLALCGFLVVCGLVERHGGIPEAIWRVDRISTAEDGREGLDHVACDEAGSLLRRA